MKSLTFISLICFLMTSCGGREKASWYDTEPSVVDDANQGQSIQKYNGYILKGISENPNKSNIIISLSHHRALVNENQVTNMNLYFDLDQFIYKLIDSNKEVIESGKIECLKSIEDQCRSFQLMSSVYFFGLYIEKGSLQIDTLDSKSTQIISSYKITFPFLLKKYEYDSDQFSMYMFFSQSYSSKDIAYVSTKDIVSFFAPEVRNVKTNLILLSGELTDEVSRYDSKCNSKIIDQELEVQCIFSHIMNLPTQVRSWRLKTIF